MSAAVSQPIILLFKKMFKSQIFSGNFREPQCFLANDSGSKDVYSAANFRPNDEGVIGIPLFTFTLFTKFDSTVIFNKIERAVEKYKKSEV